MFGHLIPAGGGDPIPLLKEKLLVGRRESCDIVLRFANVSAHHCELIVESGYWFVKDLGSRNGVKVNGAPISRKRLDPGDSLSVAKHKYEVAYSPADLGATGPPPPDEEGITQIFKESLLNRAGLEHRDHPAGGRYEAENDRPGQIKDRNKPL